MFEAFKRRQSDEEKVDELLSAYLDGALTPAERAGLEARLGVDPALRERLEDLRQTVVALSGLPAVQVPRNFILSPSMVAPARPAARQRRRRTWPVLGWATAAVSLLFLFVLAGDLFIVAPSLRREPTDIVALETQPLRQETIVGDAQDLAGTLDATLAETEQPTEPALAKGVAPAAEAPAEMMDETAVPTRAPQVGVAEAVPPPLGAGEIVSEAFSTGPPLQEGGTMSVAQEPPELRGYTPPGGTGVTVTLEAEAEMAVTPAPFAAEPAEEVPLAVSPPAGQQKSGKDGDAEPNALQEQELTSIPDSVAAAPTEGRRVVLAEEKAAQTVPFWLRVVEIGLGLAVVALAAATFFARRRAA